MARSRFTGSPEELAAIIAPHCTSASWLRYDEAEQVSAAKLDARAVRAHAPLLAKLRDVQSNLSFCKKLMGDAMAIVVRERQLEWRLNDDDARDWAETMTRRLRNMCRGTHQSCSRGKPPPWTANLPWMGRRDLEAVKDAAPAPGAEQASGSSAVAAAVKHEALQAQEACVAPQEYIFGYDRELNQAWRQLLPGGRKELAAALQAPEGASPSDAPLASWPDGMQRAITDITVEELLAMAGPRRAVRSRHHWAGVHAATHHRLVVTAKADRGTLAVVEEQGAQILQIGVKLFGADDEGHLLQALEMATRIAKKYANDEVEKAKLYELRDEYLAEIGVQVRGGCKRGAASAVPAVRKRPSAAPNVVPTTARGAPDEVEDTGAQEAAYFEDRWGIK